MLLLYSAAVLGAFGMLAIATASLLHRAGGWDPADRTLALAVGVACAPALVGVSLLPFFLTGWQPDGRRILPFLLAVLMFCCAGWRSSGYFTRAWWASWPRPGLFATLAGGGLALALVAMPLNENDALEYAAVARFLAAEGNLQHYPLVQADPISGLYAPSIHPPLFHLALVWGQAWFGDDIFMAQRLIAIWSAIGTICVVGALAGRAGRAAAGFAMLLLAATPFWLGSIAGYGIDGMRIALFTAAVASAVVVTRSSGADRAASVGAVNGLAMWAHGIGVLAPIFAVVSLLLFLAPARQWRLVLAFGLTVLLVGAGWLLRNLWTLGVAVGDDWPAANWPALAYTADLAARRGLVDLQHLVVDGALRPWVDLGLFGPAFWLALLALPLAVWRPRSELVIALIAVLGFTALALASVACDSLLLVKNPRYVLTVAPFAAVAGGIVCARITHGRTGALRVLEAALALSIIWSATSLGIRLYGLADLRLVLTGQERGFLQQPRLTGGPLLSQLATSGPGRVLSFRPPEVAIYGGRSWIDHMDPRLKEVHTGDVATAAAWMAGHEVRYALLPDYSPVTHGRSTLGLLLGDPAWAEPLSAHRGARLFRLRETPGVSACVSQPLDPAVLRHRSAGLGDVLARLSGIPHLRRWMPGLETRTTGTAIRWSEGGSADLELALEQPFQGRFVATLEMSGNGVFAVDAVLADERGQLSEIRLIDALADKAPRVFSGQWFADRGQVIRALRIRPLAPASGLIEVHNASVCQPSER